jgi:hypothetical protein
MSNHEPAGISAHEIETLTTEEAFRKSVVDQFAAVNLRLSTQDIAIASIAKQGDSTDQKLDVLLTKTSTMVDAWADGVEIKRMFCRLARVWEFLLKKVALPGLVTAVVYVLIRAIFWHGAIPEWFAAAVKLLG